MSTVRLDDSQRRASEIAAQERQIVVAGPGTGKTEVVANLIAGLIEDGIDVVEELVVISFSNAAIAAIDRRLRVSGARGAPVSTLDSFAAQIIRDSSEARIEAINFDERIAMATRIIESGLWREGAYIRHLVVDEIQDVVGIRADLLLAIIRSLDGNAGFTLLGDGAQGIYDFQLREGSTSRGGGTSSQDLLQAVQAMDDVQVRRLDGQYRAASRDARAAFDLHTSVSTASGLASVKAFEARLVHGGAITELLDAASRWPGTTAFLTSTNAQTLLVAESIAAAGHEVAVRRGAREQRLASWLGRLFFDRLTPEITKDAFRALCESRGLENVADECWRALRSISDGRSPDVDVYRVARYLSTRRSVPWDLASHDSSRFVVSTVHRSKGLEYENVVLVEFKSDEWRDQRTPPDEMARTKFVALTRAKTMLARADGPDDSRFDNHIEGDGATRWFRTGFKRRGVVAVELRPDDLATRTPDGDDAGERQHVLTDLAPSGQPVDLAIDPRESTLDLPVYAVRVNDHILGHTGPRFGSFLARQRYTGVDARRQPWPRVSGARLLDVCTVAGERAPDRVGAQGLWLAPVVSGMLNLDWNG